MQGKLAKLQKNYNNPVDYFLALNEELIALNTFIGKKIHLRFTGKINCVACDRSIKKTFQNGYCFPCFQTLAETDTCIVRPELCHFDKGTCRDESFAKTNCFIPHVVYIADSSALKVGITREHNTLQRWMDQGATKAIPFWKVENRKDSGTVEVFLKSMISDKTNWRNMLKGLSAEEDIEFKRDELLEACEDADLPGEAIYDEEITEITYPVTEYPEKISSLNFDKNPDVMGTLLGIKGQYLILDTGVINIRKFAGYQVEFL